VPSRSRVVNLQSQDETTGNTAGTTKYKQQAPPALLPAQPRKNTWSLDNQSKPINILVAQRHNCSFICPNKNLSPIVGILGTSDLFFFFFFFFLKRDFASDDVLCTAPFAKPSIDVQHVSTPLLCFELTLMCSTARDNGSGSMRNCLNIPLGPGQCRTPGELLLNRLLSAAASIQHGAIQVTYSCNIETGG
jgi:hypothetical protein